MSNTWPGEPDAFEAFEEAFERASEGRKVCETIDVAGFRIALEFAGDGLAEKMGVPFRHLRSEGSPDVVIKCWDSETTGVPLPEAIDRGPVYQQSLPGAQRDAPRRWAIERPDPGLTAYHNARSVGIYWFGSASGLTYGDLAGGLRAAIAWAMADRGLQFLHSAAVGAYGNAALVVGPSGSGKSSTALTCLLDGMDYLGDDHCLVSTGAHPVAHSVYAAAKLHTAQLARFPELDELLVNPDRDPIEKGVAILHPRFAAQLPRSLPIAALLVPAIAERPETRIEPMPRGMALRALAPSTLLQMVAADSAGLGPMGELVRNVPCYLITVGSDRAAIAREIRSLLLNVAAP